jgi:cell division protein FtsW (lipid II flippase)
VTTSYAAPAVPGLPGAPAPAPARARRPRRGAELALLVLALAIGLGAYAQVDLANGGKLPPHFTAVAIGAAAAALAAHLGVRWLAPYSDQVLLPVALAINGLGLAMIHRLDVAAALKATTRHLPLPKATAPTQLVWTGLGLLLLFAVLLLVRDPRTLQRFTYTAMVIGLALLVLPLVPGLGVTINGARIWVRVGGLSFQPSEMAKIALTIFFAGYLVVKRDALAVARTRLLGIDVPRGRDLGPILVAWLVSVGVLVFEKDLGTSLLFFGLFVALLYVATGRRGWVVIGTALFLAGSTAAYYAFSHVRVRVDVWLHPFADAGGAGYQVTQSLYGLANGGVLGTGIGQGTPDLVPYAKSDFIIAAVGEELGLTGLMALLVMYAILVERGLRTALAAKDVFGRLLACGLAFVMGLQVFIVVGGVTNLIPLTGLTTPFLSAGGSSLIANWMVIGLLLRVSDNARRPAPVPVPITDTAMTVAIPTTARGQQ